MLTWQHRIAARAAGRCHDAGAGGVDGLGLGLPFLGGIDLRPRGAVDDGVGPDLVDDPLHGRGIGDVALPLRAADHLVPQAHALIDDVAAELPGRAEHQVLQRCTLRETATG